MRCKRLIAAAAALVLAAVLPVRVLAEEYDLAKGSIEVRADDSGQYVSQTNGAQNEKQTTQTVIKQTGSNSTDNTITISTSGEATADVTIQDINVSSNGDAIGVGSSSAKITLEGENKIFSKDGSALHVSSGVVTITGSGSLEAEIGKDDDDNDSAKIGSHKDEDMSGTIHITGSATVTTKSDEEDNFDGSYGIHGDGAGIGTGESGEMSGDIIIDENANVTAFSKDDGAGIGSGYGGDMSGDITIGGSAWVIAGSNNDGAGIGAGSYGSVTDKGRIIIRDNAVVTAIGECGGTGIGAGDNKPMAGLIIIQDNAQVTAIAGDCAAAIGSDDEDDMTGTILILGNARITTGVESGVDFDYKTKKITYTPHERYIGYIGDGDELNHASSNGHYVLGSDVTINGLSGSDAEALKQYINMRLSGDNHDGEPENLTKLDIRTENGRFTVTASGEGTVEKILYNGSETVPTAPGSYPVTALLNLGGETVEIEIGTIVVPEPEPEAETNVSAPAYRVTDRDGKDIAYKAEQKDGVLTITADADFAILTGKHSGIDALMEQGIEKIVFVTNKASSAFEAADLAERGSGQYSLTHDGESVAFTMDETDVSDILMEP